MPESICLQQQAYDDGSARLLEEVADRIEHSAPVPQVSANHLHRLFNATVQAIRVEESSRLLPADRLESFIALLREIDGLTKSLASEIAAEFGSGAE
jgi:hypothetical protein